MGKMCADDPVSICIDSHDLYYGENWKNKCDPYVQTKHIKSLFCPINQSANVPFNLEDSSIYYRLILDVPIDARIVWCNKIIHSVSYFIKNISYFIKNILIVGVWWCIRVLNSISGGIGLLIL